MVVMFLFYKINVATATDILPNQSRLERDRADERRPPESSHGGRPSLRQPGRLRAPCGGKGVHSRGGNTNLLLQGLWLIVLVSFLTT